jgi:hypothetical protein
VLEREAVTNMTIEVGTFGIGLQELLITEQGPAGLDVGHSLQGYGSRHGDAAAYL